MAKTREIVCVHYICEHQCELDKKAEFYGLCQTCPSYLRKNGAKPNRVNTKKKKIELRSSSNELVEDKAIISNVSFDIDIELTNGMQKLIIHHGQDIIKVVNNFSDENNLTDESKKQIITEVKNNIK